MAALPVSVITAVYNGQDHLAECIESILNQTWSNFEFIIIDDASTDTTLDIIRKYAAQDSRICWASNDANLERSASRNKAIAMSSAALIAVMDGDDVAMPDRLKKQVDFMDAHPEIDVLGGAMEAYETGVFMPAPVSRFKVRLLFDSVVSHPTCMYRKSAFFEAGQYDLTLPPVEDYGLWVSMMDNGCQIANLSDVLVRYRTYPHEPRAVYREAQRIAKQKVCRKQLNKIEIIASRLDMDLHNFCANPKPDIPRRTVQARNWLARLQAANMQSQYLDQEELKTECAAALSNMPDPLVFRKEPVYYMMRLVQHLLLGICYRLGTLGKHLERAMRSGVKFFS